MTVFESFMIVLGVIDTLIGLGSLVISLLNFLLKRREKRNK